MDESQMHFASVEEARLHSVWLHLKRSHGKGNTVGTGRMLLKLGAREGLITKGPVLRRFGGEGTAVPVDAGYHCGTLQAFI